MSKKMNHQFACSSMMLPEHRECLQKEYRETRWREEHRRPVLDEQEQERFQQVLERSLREGAPLKLTLLDSGGYRRLTGTVSKLEAWAGRLRLNTADVIETVLIDQVVQVG